MNLEYQNIDRIEIESEGDINGFFKIYLKDGSMRSGWSCDQGSIEMDDSIPINPEIEELLFEIWESLDFHPGFENKRIFGTWRDGIRIDQREENL